MTTEGNAAGWPVLAEYRLPRLGLNVKLDKGFREGTYCIYVEFDELAARENFAAARRTARKYCAGLHGEIDRCVEEKVGRTQDGSRSDDDRRRRDLESTYLYFEVRTRDGEYHDLEMKKHFRTAFLRTNQEWDQDAARTRTQRLRNREEGFRQQLAELLDGAAYTGVDAAIKERLLSEIPALAFTRRNMEL